MTPDIPGLVIRTADAGDEAMLLEWRNDPESLRWFHDQEPVPPERHAAWLRAQLRRVPPTIWVAEMAGQPVGSVRLDQAEDAAWVISVVVAGEARGRGIGGKLLEWAEAQAPSLGCSRIVAEVRAGNMASLALFSRAGYHQVSSEDFITFQKAPGRAP